MINGLSEIRCKKCKHLLLNARIVEGEIKCSRCKLINKVTVTKNTIAEPFGGWFAKKLDEELFKSLSGGLEEQPKH